MMAPKQSYPIRNYAVGQYLLTLRSRAKLTQTELATQIGIHRRSIQKWESGETYPTAENLRALIAVLLALEVFTPGQERAEVTDLWQQISEAAPQQLPLFDNAWFDQVLAAHSSGQQSDPPPTNRVTPQVNTGPRMPPTTNWGPTQAGQHTALNLPFQPTSFIGRETELAEIARTLADPACRLLTLLGPGGIGKTRLALEVAADQAAAFSDGVAFVALAAIGTPNQIVSAIGEALGFSFAAQGDLTAALLGYLRARHLLLILDNFEHLLAGIDLIPAILSHAPGVTILITSRERTNLRAEWLFDVEGLTYPPDRRPGSAAQSMAELAGYGAVQLFIERATQVQPEFSLSEATLTAIAYICRHVAGLPLAIELAAAGVRLLPVTEIEQQIRSNLDTLATTLRDVPPRHRSLRAVFDHSWQLLSEAEQAVLSRLAIFRGGWDQAAAEAICAQVTGRTDEGRAKGSSEASDWPFLSYTFSPALLASLVDKSLVQRSNVEARPGATDTAPEPRFVLLEMIREYALEQLANRGEAAILQQAHANYYLSLAETVDAYWGSPTADAAIEQLDNEHDNLRAALEWANGEGDHTLGLQLAGALWRFWRRRGYIDEGRTWLEALLALTQNTPASPTMAARLRALNGAAWLASYQHDFTHAAQLFEQSMALRRTLGETEGEASLFDNAARAWRSAGQYRRATPLMEEALAQQRAAGDRGSLSSGGLGYSLYELGLVQREQGDFAHAAALFEEGVAFHRELGDREGEGIGLLGLSDVARDQGDIAQIRQYCQESLGILQELGVQWAIGFALNNLALAAYLEDDLNQAFALANQSVSLYRAQNAEASLAEVLVTWGVVLRAQGDMATAYEVLVEALELAQAIGPRLFAAAALEGLAGLTVQPAQSTLAAQLLGAASAWRVSMGTPIRPVDQPVVERTLATARATLGTDNFARVWEAASGLSPEQILDILPDAASFSAGAASFEVPPAVAAQSEAVSSPTPLDTGNRIDWGLAQDVPALYGRTDELAILTEWVVADQCRLISLVGIGGIGKTSLAITLARQLAPQFDAVIFRSLGEAPPLPELLDHLLHWLAAQQIATPPQVAEKLARLIDLLRQTRCLLILDNLETLRQTGTTEGQYLAGYEAYGTLFKSLGETAHRSCVILTSREQPTELAALEGPHAPVRTLRLSGLAEDASRALLADQALMGTVGDAAALARRYDGNPLALKLVAEPIRSLFSGDIAAFLSEGNLFFETVGQLLAQQVDRASALEQALLTWLAIGREPIGLDQLMKGLIDTPSRAVVLAALHALWRRNLIERGQANLTFTLQRVVLEYLTEHLVERAANEISQGDFDDLRRHALIQATAKEYVRYSQERLIATPLLERLTAADGSAETLTQRLLSLLASQRSQPLARQGYGPGNLINLLRLLRGHLRGLDLGRLTVRQAYLQGVEVQDTQLTGAVIQDSVFTEAFDDILTVAISRTGKYWAAASRRGEIWLWEADGLILRRAWRAHIDMVWKIAFSPDGNRLASVSWDGAVKLWDVVDGALLWAGRHAHNVNNLAFSPDGTRLATGGLDATLRIWDVKQGTELQQLPHPASVVGVAWSPYGHTLATGDLKGYIRLWQINATEPATCTQTIEGHSQLAGSLAFSPDGDMLATGGYDGLVKIWQMPMVSLRETLVESSKRVHLVAWSLDGRSLAWCSQNVRVWDAQQGSDKAVLQGHTGQIWTVAFAPDGRNLLSASEDGRMRVWDVESGQCIRVMQGHAAALYDVDWNPDGTQLVSGGSDALVTIFAMRENTPPRSLRGHKGVIFGVGWSRGRIPADSHLASSEADDAVRLWDPNSGVCLKVLRHPDDVYPFFRRLAWSPDGQRLAIGTFKSGVQLFELTGQPTHWTGDQPSLIRHVAWSPDGTRVAGGGDDGAVYIWDAQAGALLKRLTGHHHPIKGLAWSPDGTRLASGGRGVRGGDLLIWDAERGERIASFAGHTETISAVAWGLNQDLLVSGGGSGRLRWWDVSRSEALWVRDAHLGTVQSLRRSPDGTRLASCGDDGAIMLWDLQSGQYLQTLRRDRPYERLDITDIRGLTVAQRSTLQALGAVEIASTPL